MTIEEIYSTLSAHMIKGIMIHEQLSDYYDFLNLCGYRAEQEYHRFEEAHSYRRLHRFYMAHYDKLIGETTIETPDVISKQWYKYTRQQVDTNTKRNAVKGGFSAWVSWEGETRNLLESLYTECMSIGDILTAKYLLDCIEDVSGELEVAKGKQLCLSSVDYSIEYILSEQKALYECYNAKLQ